MNWWICRSLLLDECVYDLSCSSKEGVAGFLTNDLLPAKIVQNKATSPDVYQMYKKKACVIPSPASDAVHLLSSSCFLRRNGPFGFEFETSTRCAVNKI